jgi:ribosomal protein S18 acetylase RimI-like enzyme
MDIALSWLEERFDHLYVGVYSENFRAQELYRRYGFEKVGEYHFMVGDHADLEWIMRRSAKNIEKNPIL